MAPTTEEKKLNENDLLLDGLAQRRPALDEQLQLRVIGGTSAATSDEAIDAAQHAKDHGINHLMIMAPVRLGQDVNAHRDFFARITSELTDVEVILQNAPSPIGAGLNADAVTSLVEANPAITYTRN